MDEIKIIFQQELTNLKHLIDFFDIETKLLSDFAIEGHSAELLFLNELSEALKKISLSKRQFNYNSIVISLYGAFEKFIENCLTTYIEEISNIFGTYEALPDTIIKNHISLSMLLLNKVEQTKYSGPITKEMIISNLHACINTRDQYYLNKDAYAQHTANFRVQVIDDNFSNIGLPKISDKILQEISFKQYSIEKLGLNESDTLNTEQSFQFLNDLAERRNDVAHGVQRTILQNAFLLEYISFFEKYNAAIIDVLKIDLISKAITSRGISFGEITNVYEDGMIVCFYTNNISLKIGDTIFGKNSHGITKSKVLSIKLNDENVDYVDENSNYEIGIKVDNKLKKNHTLIIIKD